MLAATDDCSECLASAILKLPAPVALLTEEASLTDAASVSATVATSMAVPGASVAIGDSPVALPVIEVTAALPVTEVGGVPTHQAIEALVDQTATAAAIPTAPIGVSP